MARPRKGKRAAARAVRGPFPTRPVLVLLGWTALLASIVVGARQLEGHVRTAPPPETRIEWVDLPDWLMDPAWSATLTEIEQGQHMERPAPLVFPDTNIHDDQVCTYVHAVVSRSPWIEHVKKVVKLRDGRVRIHATFRAPFAVVEHLRRAHLVDASGVRLPRSWGSEFEPDGLTWLRIRGARTRLPATGERFIGTEIDAGLALASYLYVAAEEGKAPYLAELDAIDVSKYDENIGGLRIFPKESGSYIYWGHVPGEGYGVESPAEQKLEALQKLYNEWGMDAPWPFRVSNAPEITFISGPD